MEWLNYHHLFHFHAVAREGSVTGAAKSLRLAPATVSAQLRALETALGHPLFERVGRSMVVTEQGRVVQRYAEEIFGLGREMKAALSGGADDRTRKVRVGVADVVPKLIAHRILAPVLVMPERVRLEVRENQADVLLAELAKHTLDLVLTDSPIPASGRIRAYNHLLGESSISFFAVPTLAKRLRHDFPRRLHDVAMLLPGRSATIRPQLDHWFASERIEPRVVAEFDDSALMKVFGQHGAGVFVAPSILEREVATQYEVAAIGRTASVKQRFYAITVERTIKHPVAAAIAEAARGRFFEKP